MALERKARGLADDAPANPQPPLQRTWEARPPLPTTPKRKASCDEPHSFGGGQTKVISLSEFAQFGRGVPGSRQDLASIAASVSAASQDLRSQMPATQPAAAPTSQIVTSQIVRFAVKKAPGKLRPGALASAAVGAEDKDKESILRSPSAPERSVAAEVAAIAGPTEDERKATSALAKVQAIEAAKALENTRSGHYHDGFRAEQELLAGSIWGGGAGAAPRRERM